MKWKQQINNILFFQITPMQIDSDWFYSLCSDVGKSNKISVSSVSLFWLVVNGITQDARI